MLFQTIIYLSAKLYRVKFGVIIIRLYHRTCTNFAESLTQISIPYSIFFCSIQTSTPHFREVGG